MRSTVLVTLFALGAKGYEYLRMKQRKRRELATNSSKHVIVAFPEV